MFILHSKALVLKQSGYTIANASFETVSETVEYVFGMVHYHRRNITAERYMPSRFDPPSKF